MEDQVVLTEEQQLIIDRGVAAAKLLQDPTFNSVLNELATNCVNGITSSEPKEVKKREDFYFMHVALQAVHGALRARVAAAMKVQADIDADTAEDNLNTPDVPLMAADGI
jgi:hypothetical protein